MSPWLKMPLRAMALLVITPVVLLLLLLIAPIVAFYGLVYLTMRLGTFALNGRWGDQ